MKFTLVEGDAIAPNKPLLIKAGVKKEEPYPFYTTDDQSQTWFTTGASIDYGYAGNPNETVVTASDGAKIYMIGRYLGHLLEPDNFYFMHYENNGSHSYSFKRVPNQENAATIGGCRCWWVVEQNNMKSSNVMAKSASPRFFDGETNGIDEIPTRVVIDGIYDLNGRKLDVKPEELPQGLYIMNGKKVLKK